MTTNTDPRPPTTNAGKRLDSAWPGTHLDRVDWQQAIRAIELEAVGRLRERYEAVKHQRVSAFIDGDEVVKIVLDEMDRAFAEATR